MRIRWMALNAICREFSENSGCTFYIEDMAGNSVSTTEVESVPDAATHPIATPSQEVGKLRVAGDPDPVLVELCLAQCRRELDHQATVADMAEATARLWRQTNALLRMSASTNLAIGPSEVLDAILEVLDHSTNLMRGSGLVRLPGRSDFTLFGPGESKNVPLERILALDTIEDDVLLISDHRTDEAIMSDCRAVLGRGNDEPRPVAIARLATENDRYGFLLVPAESADRVTSEDFKVLGAAAQILGVAVENSHTLLREREATRLGVENEMLAAQAREMEEMLHVVAHDLRSPMTALYGFMHVALEQVNDLSDTLRGRRNVELANRATTIAEPLETGIRSVEKLNHMVQRVLDFSRATRADYNFGEVDLRPLVDEILQSFTYQIAELEIDVEVGTLPVIDGDRGRLEIVFRNLIDNAIKYMGDQPPQAILIGCEERREEGERVYCVEDTGIGMTKDQTAKAFLPFRRFRGDAAPGEGIGLPFVRKIIERHGGRIWCESREGVGTRFFFTLEGRGRGER